MYLIILNRKLKLGPWIVLGHCKTAKKMKSICGMSNTKYFNCFYHLLLKMFK